jgi:hypothetical protein
MIMTGPAQWYRRTNVKDIGPASNDCSRVSYMLAHENVGIRPHRDSARYEKEAVFAFKALNWGLPAFKA